MDLQQILSVILSVLGSLILVCLAVLLGWYCVWKVFLSRFRLVRELLGQISDGSPSTNGSKSSDSTKGRVKKTRRD
ncbi:small integral membrane protein 13 [Sitodiplosis mosellana]|uniref:small integral membrane protein 13 n=1 Tax=Sitodiplosis mosellana TaxID=263140 RepID=UPI002444D8AF|nr:small integral membrane protein 13 [Sitodiplosis mosellana]XP_055323421.1 small integral membrane protein 13 [Sitodiplosis mosellana]